MRSAFELRVSTEPPFRALAAEVAARFVDVAGGSADEGRAFGAEVDRAVAALAGGPGTITCRFAAEDRHVEVALDRDGEVHTVRRTLSARTD